MKPPSDHFHLGRMFSCVIQAQDRQSFLQRGIHVDKEVTEVTDQLEDVDSEYTFLTRGDG